jgi:hypothetical protein
MRKLALLPLVTLLLACEDNPVQLPAADDAAVPPLAFRADVSGWQLRASFPSEFTDFIPCFNDGTGEVANWYATALNIWEREVRTPSGNINRQQKITFTGDVYWEGTVSEEVWTMVRMTQPGHVHTKKSDGKTYATWVLHELYENAAGKLITMRSIFKNVYYDYEDWWDTWDPDEAEFSFSCGGSGAH